MPAATQVSGKNTEALFSLKIHRGEGMALIAMNWREGRPPDDFSGFAIEYQEPGGDRFYALKNRLSFPPAPAAAPAPAGATASHAPKFLTTECPIQAFRWVHFPRNADLAGLFRYRVTPRFMNANGELSSGAPQTADIELAAETYPDQLNIVFTRGYVSSQSFTDTYGGAEGIRTLMPEKADDGLTFTPSHAMKDEAYKWMGFEARREILAVLDSAIADPTAQVSVIAYDLNLPELVERLEKLEGRLRVIIDDSVDTKKTGEKIGHGAPGSAEEQAALRLTAKLGAANVKRQHMLSLQHNKSIVVSGDRVKTAIGGSTNFSWRGFYIQANNAIIVKGADAIKPFADAFDAYFNNADAFKKSGAVKVSPLGLAGIDASVTFSPHGKASAQLGLIAAEISGAKSSVFYSLAFLAKTTGAVRDALAQATNDDKIFVYGMAEGNTKFIIENPDGNKAPVFFKALSKAAPAPFKIESDGEFGTHIHHKFVVIDFDVPDKAKVICGSYNFSKPADEQNGENLFFIKDHRIAVSYMVEALRLFDTYSFRIRFNEAKKVKQPFALKRPPKGAGEKPWFDEFYTKPQRVRDRELFS